MKGSPFEWSVTDCSSLVKVETFGRYGILYFIRIFAAAAPPPPPLPLSPPATRRAALNEQPGVLQDMNAERLKVFASLVAEMLRHLRARRATKARLLREALIKYVAACGGWCRAFPSSENGDVAIPFHFNLDEKEDYWILERFRFSRADIDRVRRLLGIPDIVITHNRDRCPGLWAFCMLLYKLSWPRLMCDFRDTFGGTKQRCGRIVNHVAVFLYLRFSAKMSSLDRERYNDDYILRLCEAGFQKNGVMENIWGFIDATIRPCARPVRFQKVVYNGKNKVHSIKFQTVVTWDGMIAHVAGPWPGARHDSGIFNESSLPQVLSSLPFISHDRLHRPLAVALYADEGYALSNRVFIPYPDGRVDALHQAFNQKMSQSRITVEWGYHTILRSWAALDFKRNLKLFKSPIAAYYVVAALLTNVQSCLNTYNDITLYTGMNTPTVEEYLRTLASD